LGIYLGRFNYLRGGFMNLSRCRFISTVFLVVTLFLFSSPIEAAYIGDHYIKDIDIMVCPLGDFDERWDVAPKAQESMHFDSGLMFSEISPGKD
jgi:hypothetical protein